MGAIIKKVDAWGRLIAIVMRASLRLARITATPGGLIAAMPLIWELVCSVLAELDPRREPAHQEDARGAGASAGRRD